MKFRKKPVVIEAFWYGYESQPEWFLQARSDGLVVDNGDYCVIKTLEGDMRADLSDWIVQGGQGEIYPIKNQIFKMTYDPVEETE